MSVPSDFRSTNNNNTSNGVWVFGYGSLLWNPGFNYSRSLVGSINGYKRRFWQGNDLHRGSPEKLGRVVTLVSEKEAITWGRAYLLDDAEVARNYLDKRESIEGGYETKMISFKPRDTAEPTFQVIVYIALPTNRLFLGPAATLTIARDISSSSGDCGHNVEYLAKLVAFMRYHWPDIWDDHLYELESHVKSILGDSSPHLLSLFETANNDEAIRLLKTLEGFKILNFDFDWSLEQNMESIKSELDYIQSSHDLIPSKGVRVSI